MSSSKKDSSSESAPLLQQQDPGRSPSNSQSGGPPNYAAGTGAPAAGMPQPQYAPVGYPNNAIPPGYFMPPPGQYQIPMQQLQPGPGDGPAGMVPYFYPFPMTQAPEGGAMPQYQYPVYPVQQPQQPRGPANGSALPVDTITHSPKGSGSLPALRDIFDASGGKEGQPVGYGSMAMTPDVYNAPVARLPPSGRAPQQAPLRRSNSLGEFKHRRVNSDTPLRANRVNRRGSADELRGSGHNRARTLSGGNPVLQRPRHRRANSASSYHSIGRASPNGGASIADSSQVSMRSNIAKSSLFAGVDGDGRPLLYYPYEATRLVMIPDLKKRESKSVRKGGYEEIADDDTAEEEFHLPLTIGHLYSQQVINMDDYYEDYHRVSDDMEQGITPQWESLDAKNKKSTLRVEDGEDLLPPTNYVVAVSDDIYRRIFSEIADAQTMPCGLFFCGHHEDVDHPSFWIPATLVIILLSTMAYLSYITGW